ncbi:MAG: hypothetical protein HYS98_04250 [Deltaproteobacteria bacterium]|nr:hypothetical protein [Deltaproteobacteria bacterium]
MISENLVINFQYVPYIVLLFISVIIVLHFFLFRPVLRILDERKKRLHTLKEDSSSMRERAHNLQQRRDKELEMEQKHALSDFGVRKKEIEQHFEHGYSLELEKLQNEHRKYDIELEKKKREVQDELDLEVKKLAALVIKRLFSEKSSSKDSHGEEVWHRQS